MIADWFADPRCLQAFVSLFTVANGEEYLIRHIGRFCNENRPPENPIVSTSSALELLYSVQMTPGGNSKRGFLARYRMKDVDVDLLALDAGHYTQGTIVIMAELDTRLTLKQAVKFCDRKNSRPHLSVNLSFKSWFIYCFIHTWPSWLVHDEMCVLLIVYMYL